MFELKADCWYAWEMLPGYTDGFEPYRSPIYVHHARPLKTGKGLLRLSFFNAFYAAGVQGFDMTLRVLQRWPSYLVTSPADSGGTSHRTIIIGEMSIEWLRRSTRLLDEYPLELQTREVASDPRMYLDAVFSSRTAVSKSSARTEALAPEATVQGRFWVERGSTYDGLFAAVPAEGVRWWKRDAEGRVPVFAAYSEGNGVRPQTAWLLDEASRCFGVWSHSCLVAEQLRYHYFEPCGISEAPQPPYRFRQAEHDTAQILSAMVGPIFSGIPAPKTAAMLFEGAPPAFSLRGDAQLWVALRAHLKGTALPPTSEAVRGCLEEAYELLVGQPIHLSEALYVESLAAGGMSSGHVDPAFWREVAIPHLVSRFDRLGFV